MKKRIPAMLLIACIIFTNLPITTFATELGENKEKVSICDECGKDDGIHIEGCSLDEDSTEKRCSCGVVDGAEHRDGCALSKINVTKECICTVEEGKAHQESCILNKELAKTECSCGTDDENIHATSCALYKAPAKPECLCVEKCEDGTVNVWCDVCGVKGVSSCIGGDGAQAYALADFEQYEVESIAPKNVTMHLFDYWVKDNRDDADTTGEEADGSRGINNGHMLRFRSGGNGGMDSGAGLNGNYDAYESEDKMVQGNLNHGTSHNSILSKSILRPRQGIVANKLGADGYPRLYGSNHDFNGDLPNANEANISPQLFDGFNWTGNDEITKRSESLKYLFDPKVNHSGKKSFENVTGLFQQDSEGYYYYNSMGDAANGYIQTQDNFDSANYTYFDENENRFRLYNTHAVGSNEGAGQFFPFDGPDEVFEIDNGTLKSKSGLMMNNPGLNHYFGMYIEIPFIQTPDGQIFYNGQKQDTIFNFSGDDDLWLYVDDVLVGDVGGIHGASTLDINFATGSVVVNRDEGSIQVPGTQITTLKDIYARAGKSLDKNDVNANTYANGSHHTIRVFYLERGNSASNLGIKFNLSNIPVSKVIKFDEEGTPLANAQFAIYQADKDAKGNYTIKKDANGQEMPPLYDEGKTDENGEFLIVDENGNPLLLSSLPGDYFIGREIGVPDGYRTSGDIHFKKHTLTDGSVVLVTDTQSPTGSKWSTGSYAAAIETTNVADENVYLREDRAPYSKLNDKQVVKDGDLVGLDGQPGTMFAIVLKWTNGRPNASSDLLDLLNGTPVYGNAESGYKVASLNIPNGATQEERSKLYRRAVLEALVANPYIFEKDDTGRYAVTINNMPGDISQYLHGGADLNDLHYTIMYGWTNLTEEQIKSGNLTSADADNYVFSRLYSDDFSRNFSVNFRVVNIKDNFEVLKVDENNVPINGAEFALYKKRDVKVNQNGSFSLVAGAVAVDVGTTDVNGKIAFPTGTKMLSSGEYYLIETGVPSGFANTPAPIHVIVDTTGVYVNAGTANDCVKVQRGVGSLVETMHEFAIDNDIDETLHNIIYKKQAGSVGGDGKISWSNVSDADAVHLMHDSEDHGGSHKGYVDANGNVVNYTVDEGWSKLLIQQCPQHKNSGISFKDNLGEKDITNLFTKNVTVIVENRRTPIDVKLGGVKKLEKEDGSLLLEDRVLRENEFSFKLEPLNNSPMPNDADHTMIWNGADGRFEFPIIALDRVGSYQYKISEEKGKDLTIKYDEGYWKVEVVVSIDSTTNELKHNISYTKYDKEGNAVSSTENGEFVNIYNAIDPIIPEDTPTDDPSGDGVEDNGNNTHKGDNPITRDSTKMVLWIGLALATILGITSCVIIKKRKYMR